MTPHLKYNLIFRKTANYWERSFFHKSLNFLNGKRKFWDSSKYNIKIIVLTLFSSAFWPKIQT